MLSRPDVSFFDTATAAIRKTVHVSVGGFRSSMAAVEDTEFAFRLHKAGYGVHLVPDAFVTHRHPATWRTYVRRKARFGRWGARAYGAYPKRVVGDSRTPWAMRIQMLIMLLALPVSVTGASAGLIRARPNTLGWVLATVLASFTLTTIPASIRYLRRGHGLAVALAWPLAAGLRALALDLGLLYGTIEGMLQRTRREGESDAEHR